MTAETDGERPFAWGVGAGGGYGLGCKDNSERRSKAAPEKVSGTDLEARGAEAVVSHAAVLSPSPRVVEPAGRRAASRPVSKPIAGGGWGDALATHLFTMRSVIPCCLANSSFCACVGYGYSTFLRKKSLSAENPDWCLDFILALSASWPW